jgi:Asp-tRNA(Asn)/Glu-tRNA(Gln) amidotransferase B subunit
VCHFNRFELFEDEENISVERDEETGDCIRLHNVEFHNLNSSRNIIKMIKSRRMRWVERVARMGEMRNAFTFLAGSDHLEDKSAGGRKKFKWILGK